MIIRYCRKCKTKLDLSRYFHCKQCILPGEDFFRVQETSNKMEVDISGFKECSKCEKTLSKTEFHKQRQVNSCGLQPKCKTCYNEDQRNRRKAKNE